jgi:hypothetical protein
MLAKNFFTTMLRRWVFLLVGHTVPQVKAIDALKGMADHRSTHLLNPETASIQCQWDTTRQRRPNLILLNMASRLHNHICCRWSPACRSRNRRRRLNMVVASNKCKRWLFR